MKSKCSFLTSDLMREARTRALELKKKKVAAKPQMQAPKKAPEKKVEPKTMKKAITAEPPPKINLSSDSNLSEDLKAFERDLISESDHEDQRNESTGTIYVQETSSGRVIRK